MWIVGKIVVVRKITHSSNLVVFRMFNGFNGDRFRFAAYILK